MFGVVPARQLAGDLHHLEGDQLEPSPFQPPNDFADQPSLDTVGFDQDQRPLHSS